MSGERRVPRPRRVPIICASALAVLLLVLSAALWLVRAPEPKAEGARLPEYSVSVTPAALPARDAAEAAAPQRARLPYCYNILLAGLDSVGGGSDTMLLARFDAQNRRIDLVSLPRDTLLHHEWHSNRLNYAYASGGMELLRSEVENLLGVPVDYYMTVDLAGFVALIDSIGGVDFEVPADMDYDDPAQGLHIHLSRGMQHLGGEQAMEVVRWRRNNDGGGYASADLGRIATQQAFLRAAAEKAARLGNAPALARLLFASVKTDLSPGNLAWLAREALDMGAGALRFHTLPGDGGGCWRGESVYVLDPDATLELVNEALDPYDQPVSAAETDIFVP